MPAYQSGIAGNVDEIAGLLDTQREADNVANVDTDRAMPPRRRGDEQGLPVPALEVRVSNGATPSAFPPSRLAPEFVV